MTIHQRLHRCCKHFARDSVHTVQRREQPQSFREIVYNNIANTAVSTNKKNAARSAHGAGQTEFPYIYQQGNKHTIAKFCVQNLRHRSRYDTNATCNMQHLSREDVSRIIEMAWEDRTPFEAIRTQFGLLEGDVIRLMRREMQASSFRMWRKRVSGRTTKHAHKRPEGTSNTPHRFKSSNQKPFPRH